MHSYHLFINGKNDVAALKYCSLYNADFSPSSPNYTFGFDMRWAANVSPPPHRREEDARFKLPEPAIFLNASLLIAVQLLQ